MTSVVVGLGLVVTGGLTGVVVSGFGVLGTAVDSGATVSTGAVGTRVAWLGTDNGAAGATPIGGTTGGTVMACNSCSKRASHWSSSAR